MDESRLFFVKGEANTPEAATNRERVFVRENSILKNSKKRRAGIGGKKNKAGSV